MTSYDSEARVEGALNATLQQVRRHRFLGYHVIQVDIAQALWRSAGPKSWRLTRGLFSRHRPPIA